MFNSIKNKLKERKIKKRTKLIGRALSILELNHFLKDNTNFIKLRQKILKLPNNCVLDDIKYNQLLEEIRMFKYKGFEDAKPYQTKKLGIQWEYDIVKNDKEYQKKIFKERNEFIKKLNKLKVNYSLSTINSPIHVMYGIHWDEESI